MKSLRMSVPIMAVLMMLLLLTTTSEAAISCSAVIKYLNPCVNYLKSGSGKPPAACCTGASALETAASAPVDKKAACECLKSAAKKMNPNSQLAQALPANCGIKLSIPVSPNVDCTKVS